MLWLRPRTKDHQERKRCIEPCQITSRQILNVERRVVFKKTAMCGGRYTSSDGATRLSAKLCQHPPTWGNDTATSGARPNGDGMPNTGRQREPSPYPAKRGKSRYGTSPRHSQRALGLPRRLQAPPAQLQELVASRSLIIAPLVSRGYGKRRCVQSCWSMSGWVIQRHAEVCARCLFLPIADTGCGVFMGTHLQGDGGRRNARLATGTATPTRGPLLLTCTSNDNPSPMAGSFSPARSISEMCRKY